MTAKKDYKNKIPPLQIGDISVPIPIIQGGMGIGISMEGLATAVAKAGGIGVLAAVLIGFEDEGFLKDPKKVTLRSLERQIKNTKKASNGVVGVNIMVALDNYGEICRTAAIAGADLIISGAGLPLKLPGMIPEECNTKLAPIVSSGRAVAIICKRWLVHYDRLPDAIIVEGPKAGGHLGFKAEDLEKEDVQIETLLKDVCASVTPFESKKGVKIPVIAAGGIYDGKDIYNIMKLGAAGVQMGTRFVVTEECDASDAFKKAYVNATKEDVVIIKSPVGMPGRALSGKFTQKVAAGEKSPKNCIYHCLKPCTYPDTPYCISMALMNAKRGHLDAGFVFCGANVWRVDRIIKVQELMDELVQGYLEAANQE